MNKLTSKVAVVTGASKGIRAVMARHLAAEGASVVVHYSSGSEGADNVVNEIVMGGGKAIAVGADASTESGVAKLFSETQAAYGITKTSTRRH
jgi:3-oxoacyl-[acyl-carrier protein] reductase